MLKVCETSNRFEESTIFAIIHDTFMSATFTAVIEHCSATNLYVGYVPGFAGAHSQGSSIQELMENLREVCAMLLEDGVPVQESEFVTTQQLVLEA